MHTRRPRLTPPMLVLPLIAWLSGPVARAASPVLRLADGGFVAGELKDSDRPSALRWQSPAFTSPFEFPLDAVRSVDFPPPTTVPRPTGEYGFELAGGDVLFGSLVSLDSDRAEIESPRVGRVRVRRSSLRRIYRWDDRSDLVYLGPNGLDGWREPSSKKGWREDGGQLATDRPAATIRADLGLPARAVVEFEVSWKDKPDFVLALGVDDDERVIKRAFRFEVWGDNAVVEREAEHVADLASIKDVAAGPGRIHAIAYLDQERGHMLVFSPSGRRLADLLVPEAKPKARPGVQLTNVRGDIRLEWLRVGRWDGEPPREVQADRARIHRADGSIAYGRITKYDAASKEFVVLDGSTESRIAAAKFSAAFLSPPGDDGPPRAVRAVAQDGTRLSGDLVGVEGGAVRLDVPGIEGAVRLPTSGLRSLVSTRPKEAAPGKEEPTPYLEMEGLRLPGSPVGGGATGDASPLEWRPHACASASPIRRGVSGRIVFREPPPPPKPLPQSQRVRRVAPPQPPGLGRRVFNALVGDDPGVKPATPPGGRFSLFLRTGDVIPAEVATIDERGVTFKSPLSTRTFVAHDRIKAVELAAVSSAPIRLTKSKRERLLTLPRMQKGSPPTHLIRSREGDYLRGRVVGLDAATLRVEVRLETKEVPRDRVARIIWFHADEIEGAKAPASPAEPAGTTRVQALRNDGTRLTFLLDRLDDGALSGRSDVLGDCRVRLNETDQVLIGGAIERAAAGVAYGPWRLHDAPEPRSASADGAPTSGTESALVGKPAPDFELDLLDGKKFHLADAKGQVVLLDFWATWCGPCLQAMPQVEAVAREFEAKGVRLVAVNLQEDAKPIAAMLERHKLAPAVALDRDGVVAQRYEANAIPQTVVIGRDGKVARLFVGGGPHLGDQLREALTAVLEGGGAK